MSVRNEDDGLEPDGAGGSSPAARPDLDDQVRNAWREVLDVEEIRSGEDFFDRGGTSLEAIRLADELFRTTGRPVSASAVIEHPRLEALVAHLNTLPVLEECGPARVIVNEADDRPAPLTDVQQLLWIEARKDGLVSTHNIAYQLDLQGELDIAHLRDALEDVIRRHDSLRMVFDPGRPRQQPHPEARLELEILDVTGTIEELQPSIQTFITRPIDLVSGPPLRGRLLRRSSSHHLLIISLSHFVADGWSRVLLTRDLGAFYRHRAHGEPLALPPVGMSYADHARLENQPAVRQEMERRLRERIAALGDRGGVHRPRSCGPLARPLRFETRLGLVDPGWTEDLRRITVTESCTFAMLFLTVTERLLARLSGQRDFHVAMPTLNQVDSRARETVGMFSNNLLLAARVLPGEPWRDHLHRVRRELLDALEHRLAPYRHLEHATAGVTVLFNMLPAGDQGFEAPGLVARPLAARRYRNRYPLSIRIESVPEGWLLDIGTVAGYIAPGDVDSLFDTVDTLLGEMVEEIGEAPAERAVERRLAKHPAIEDSVVLEWPDPARGKIFVAYVISRTSLTLDELKAHCASHLPPERVPSFMVLTRSFPPGLTGAARREALKERFRQTLNRGKRS